MCIVVFPPVIEESITNPVLFLAGPIQGVSNWQKNAVGILQTLGFSGTIACPRNFDWKPGERPADDIFTRQADWETCYLRQAGSKGVIMFWLPAEEMHSCRRAYAQTSRFELGEWTARHALEGAKLVVGVSPTFTNGGYILHRLREFPNIPVRSTLEETCEASIGVLTL